MSQQGGREELSDVLNQLIDNTEGDEISLEDLVEALDNRSFGPLLLLVGLVAASPIGAVPGMSLVSGSLVVLLSGQILLGRSSPWLPRKLLSITFARERLTKTVRGGRPWVKWFEKALHHRAPIFTRGPAFYGVAVVCIVLGVTFYPLALLPFAVFLPAVAVTLLALGVTARDGVLVLVGYALTAVAIGILVAYWPF